MLLLCNNPIIQNMYAKNDDHRELYGFRIYLDSVFYSYLNHYFKYKINIFFFFWENEHLLTNVRLSFIEIINSLNIRNSL